MMHVLVFPPSESRSSRVSLESLCKARRQSCAFNCDVQSLTGYATPTVTHMLLCYFSPKDQLSSARCCASACTAVAYPPVGNVSRVLDQRCDDPPKGQQALVDVARLTSTAVLGTRPAHTAHPVSMGIRLAVKNTGHLNPAHTCRASLHTRTACLAGVFQQL